MSYNFFTILDSSSDSYYEDFKLELATTDDFLKLDTILDF